jgi:hypothetical protein
MLGPTVSRPIRLGVGHPFGAHDQIVLFPFAGHCFSLRLGALRLTRGLTQLSSLLFHAQRFTGTFMGNATRA